MVMRGRLSFHLEVCDVDNELITESAYFDADRDKRFLKASEGFYSALKVKQSKAA